MGIFARWSTDVNAMLVEHSGFSTASAKRSVTFARSVASRSRVSRGGRHAHSAGSEEIYILGAKGKQGDMEGHRGACRPDDIPTEGTSILARFAASARDLIAPSWLSSSETKSRRKVLSS